MGPAGGDGEARLEDLQRRLKAKRADSEQLQQEINLLRTEKDAAKTACLAGVEAAKVQTGRLTVELRTLKQRMETFNFAEVQPSSLPGPLSPAVQLTPPPTAEGARLEALRLQTRHLRHELSKWRHQAEMLETESQGQEQEIAYLKAQLTHARDVLESTRFAVRHHEVDRQLREAALVPFPEEGSIDSKNEVRFWQGGDPIKLAQSTASKTNLEAKCERNIRGRVEERADVLSSKAQKLMGIVSSQQLVIQRLEKQLLKEEDALEQRSWQLAGVARQRQRLKGALRQRSDGVVALAVGVPGMKRRSLSLPPGRCSDAGLGTAGGVGKSPSATQLPLIEAAH